jgi:hypothetical protein
MIESGSIADMGTYEDLKNKDGVFSEFIKIYLASNEINKKSIGKKYTFFAQIRFKLDYCH